MVVDSSIQHDDERLHLNRYKLATADNPNNDKGDGVGIYFKEFLATSQMELNNLNECIILHPKQNKDIVSLYRSPSHAHDEFDDFLLNFEQICDIIARNPLFLLLTNDFNATAAN